MAKKVTPSDSTSETSSEKADPVVLGVDLPLNLTVSSLKVLAGAWQQALTGLGVAVQEVVQEKVKRKSEPAPESSSSSDSNVATA